MTERLPFTKASVRRMIQAAKAEGFSITGIAPDGTLLLAENLVCGPSISPPTPQSDPFLAGIERVPNAQTKRERKRVAS